MFSKDLRHFLALKRKQSQVGLRFHLRLLLCAVLQKKTRIYLNPQVFPFFHCHEVTSIKDLLFTVYVTSGRVFPVFPTDHEGREFHYWSLWIESRQLCRFLLPLLLSRLHQQRLHDDYKCHLRGPKVQIKANDQFHKKKKSAVVQIIFHGRQKSN